MIIFQSGKSLLQYFTSFTSALVHLFPNIGIDTTKFNSTPRMLLFFRFSFLLPYAVHCLFVVFYLFIIFYYFFSFSFHCLKYIHNTYKGNYWKDDNNKRKFFIDFAKEKKFDPLHPQNWYSLSFSDFHTLKVCISFSLSFLFSHH
jgi:hypothetical protein